MDRDDAMALEAPSNGKVAVPHPLPEPLAELIARRFRVLGEPTRIKLLDVLREHDATVTELHEALGASQQNVSKHLGVLLQAGIVSRAKEGTSSRYAIADDDVFALCEHVCGVVAELAELRCPAAGRVRAMIFRQFIHDDLGCGSYLVGDEDAGAAAVIDPKLDVEDYLAMARYMGVRIEHILETHNHADHVSGHGRLAAATGATIHIHRLAAPDYDHEPFDDGWELELGTVTIRAIHTPGHRPEHTAFALIDRARGDEPWAVLSGDTLFVGDIARPDLAVEKKEGAHAIFRSLHDKLLVLPGECEVWPGHVGGSLCGGPGMDMKVSSTIAFEQRHNRLLQLSDEDAFVRATTRQLGPQPPNFKAIVALNRGPLRTGGFEPRPLATGDVERKQATGALLVDVRIDDAYDAAHIPGAVCNPVVRAGFGTKLAWIANRDQEVMLVGEGDSDAMHAAQLAVSVGIDKIAGYLRGGMQTWCALNLPTDSLERIDVPTLYARRDELQVLDVRERYEWDAGHIPGSVHMPYHDVTGIPEGIDPSRRVAVICASGPSAVGASLLALHGADHVIHVAGGGVGTWQRNGWPVTPAQAPVTA